MRYKLSRAHYVDATAVEVRDPESSAVGYMKDRPGRFSLMAFSGKRQKPDFSYWYATEAARADKWRTHCENVRRIERYQQERREQRKAITSGRAALEFNGQTYLSAADVAALCRRTLKESFPGTRFSVTSDGSIRVQWKDGPSVAAVEKVAKIFAGSYFDGMIDYKGSIYHSLDGRKVRFGADFVFTSRDISAEALEIGRIAYEAAGPGRAGAVRIDPADGYNGAPKVVVDPDHPQVVPNGYGDPTISQPDGSIGTRFSAAAEHALALWFDHAQPVEAMPSPTLARIAILGSDGYGVGGGDPADGGEGLRGYPRPKEPEDAQSARDAIKQAEEEAAAVLAAEALQRASERLTARPTAQIIPFPRSRMLH